MSSARWGRWLGELRRRKVFRVAAGYVVAGWLVLQVADVLLPAFGIGDVGIRVLFGVLLAGLPIASVIAWLYDLTPTGLRREASNSEAGSAEGIPGRSRTRLLVGATVLVGFFFAAGWWLAPDSSDGVAIPAERASIAVLPFADMSAAGDHEWFSEGVSEELLNLLTAIPGLRVIARSSSFQFKDAGIDVRHVADTLGTDYVLQGSVRRAGQQLRITAQLVRGVDGSQLWSRRFDREAGDVFRIQDEIARAVTAELRLSLLGEEAAARSAPRTTEAYDLYLRGQYFANRFTPADWERARTYLTAALDEDPEYAAAWGKLSVVYGNMLIFGSLPSDSSHLAREALERAVELEPADPTNWSRLAMMEALIEWNRVEAERMLDRVLTEYGPQRVDPGALTNLAILSVQLGRLDEGVEYARLASLGDPLNPTVQGNLGFALYYAGALDEAEAVYRRTLELAPETGLYRYRLSNVLLLQGRLDEALAALDADDPGRWDAAGLPLVYHALGRDEAADQALAALEAGYADTNALALAEAYAYQGDTDRALAWMRRAVAQRDGRLMYVAGNPLLRQLDEDPEYRRLLAEAGLPH